MNQSQLQQLKQAKNKDAFMYSMLPEEQRVAFQQFKQMDTQTQAQRIADYCNQHGITKEQLKQMINGIN